MTFSLKTGYSFYLIPWPASAVISFLISVQQSSFILHCYSSLLQFILFAQDQIPFQAFRDVSTEFDLTVILV